MQEEPRQENPGFTVKKKVDESWKSAVDKEKSQPLSPGSEPVAETGPGKPDFIYFISSLGMQALAALGDLPEESGVPPAEIDLGQAKYLIDILEMIAIKTKSNLSPEEKTALDGLLYQLRLKFVQKSRPA